MISSVVSSLSPALIPHTKNSEAYRRYTTLESVVVPISSSLLHHGAIYAPLYSKKLHILVRRARTSWVTSFTIFDLTFGASVVNHFASRTLPRCIVNAYFQSRPSTTQTLP